MNFINLNESELDQHIYRITEQKYVFSMFQDGKNMLNRVCNWKDKFENFLMTLGHENGGERSENIAKNNMVAQCWTKETYSEAMWGIYANDKNKKYLRIRSTPRKLLSALISARPTLASDCCHFGKVKYQRERDLRKYYESAKSQNASTPRFIEALLLKRKSFEHERELRIIYFDYFKDADDLGHFWYNVNPHEMVTQIMADPNRDRSEWAAERRKIEQVTKFTGEIKRSKVYDAPDW